MIELFSTEDVLKEKDQDDVIQFELAQKTQKLIDFQAKLYNIVFPIFAVGQSKEEQLFNSTVKENQTP